MAGTLKLLKFCPCARSTGVLGNAQRKSTGLARALGDVSLRPNGRTEKVSRIERTQTS